MGEQYTNAMKRCFYFICGGLSMILLVSTPAPAQNFHNQFISGGAHAIPHSVQMGYDYVQESGAHDAGLKQLIYLAADQVALRIRDGAYQPKNGMTAVQIAEYDQYTCIRDPNTYDPAFRYYIEWVNPAFDLSTQTNGPVQLMFYVNYQSKVAMDAAIAFYQTHLDWENINSVVLDQAEYEFTYYLIN